MASCCAPSSGIAAALMEQIHRRRPAEQRDDDQDEQHGEDHERDAAVRAGDLARVVGAEARIARAEAGRQADEREAHEDDRRRAATTFRNGSTPSSSLAAIVSTSVSTQHRHEPGPELRPQEVAQRDRRRADDPERRPFGRHRRKHEPHGDRRHHEPGHPEVHERVDVLDERRSCTGCARDRARGSCRDRRSTSASSSSSCDHWLTSRRNIFRSLTSSCRRTVDSGSARTSASSAAQPGEPRLAAPPARC